MAKRKYSDKELLLSLEWMRNLLHCLRAALVIEELPFDFNPHRLYYTKYRCVKCWQPGGARNLCAHRKKD